MLTLFWRQDADRLAVAAHFDRGGGDLAVQGVVLRNAEVRERIGVAVRAAQRHRLAGLQRRFGLGLVRHPREGDEQDDQAGVHDVAAVATPVARDETTEGEDVRLGVLAVAGAPAPSDTSSVRPPAVAGTANWRRRLGSEARRQAISGPIPVRASKARPRGMFTRLKNGGPTVTLVPCTSSERIWNNVTDSTENAIPIRSKLLNRKLASRLTIDSSRVSAPSNGSRLAYSVKLAIAAAIRKNRKK